MERSKRSRRRARSSISRARGYEEIGDYWDSHDLVDVPTEPISFSVAIKRRQFLVAVDPGMLKRLREEAARRGMRSETLINLWLGERLAS